MARAERARAGYVRARFAASDLGNWARQIVTWISKLSSGAILWFGAPAVMRGEIRFDRVPYRYTRYDLIAKTVLDVSRDAVAERPETRQKRGHGREDGDLADEPSGSGGYVAHVALSRTSMLTEGGPVELGPGMSVTAEIKTGERRVISYLLSPIARYPQENLRER